ncbi:hypothetical protein D3C87_1464200 [compost metagenome]
MAIEDANGVVGLELHRHFHHARDPPEREFAGDQVAIVAQGVHAARFKRRHWVARRVEPGGLLQFFVGIAAAGVDAVEVDAQCSVRGGGVVGVEIEGGFELAKGAVGA